MWTMQRREVKNMAPRKEANGDVEEAESGYRLSITIDPSIRRKMRLAAALHDKSIGEWASSVLENAADKAVADLQGKVKM
jgi:predicted HicB family RNase H-like nuclease